VWVTRVHENERGRNERTNECGFGFRRTTHDDDDTTHDDDDNDACDDEFRVFIIVVIDDAVGRDRARVDGGRRRWGKKTRRETVWREKTRKTRDARRRKDDGVGGFDGRGGDEK